MKGKGFIIIISFLCLVIIFSMMLSKFFVKENIIESYSVFVTDTYDFWETKIISEIVPPLAKIWIKSDVSTVIAGSIEGGYPEAYKEVLQSLSINPSNQISFTTPNDTILVNPFFVEGEYNAGYIAALVHYIAFTIQEGYVIPIYSDGTVGELKKFKARMPVRIWQDWKWIQSFNPQAF